MHDGHSLIHEGWVLFVLFCGLVLVSLLRFYSRTSRSLILCEEVVVILFGYCGWSS
uniref:Uncharacterized protein n=1 Tax=Physcomitrium patens TaxID=3218 RepID=A0A2K1JX27_PHYPA|nr:hypothetical protein PHYPA_013219 [Physcomitrium patens]